MISVKQNLVYDFAPLNNISGSVPGLTMTLYNY